MGRKRKVPPGMQLRTWCDSYDETSDDENCSQLPPLNVSRAILPQDLSPTPSAAPSTEFSGSSSRVDSESTIPSPPSDLGHDPDNDLDSNLASEVVGTLQSPPCPTEHPALDQDWEFGIGDRVPPEHPPLDDGDGIISAALSDSPGSIRSGFGIGDRVTTEHPPLDDSDSPGSIRSEFMSFMEPEETEAEDTDDTDQDDIESLESWEGDDTDQEEENEYITILQALSEKWLMVELSHTVSKAGTNAFWELAMSVIPSLFEAKKRIGIRRKVPQFIHVRRKLHKKFLPPIQHATTYRQDGSLNIIEVQDQKDPRPDDSYTKILESASVSVIQLIYFHLKTNSFTVLTKN